MANDPIDDIDGLANTDDVSKNDFRSTLKERTVGVFTTCVEVRNISLASRTRIIAGSRFFRKDTTDTTADDLTETTPCIIDAGGNHWLPIEGERYDLQFSFTGPIGPGEELNPAGAPVALEFLAGLPGSFLYAVDTVPTSGFTVTFKKSLDYGATWTSVFTATISAGQRVAAFTLAADFSIPAGALLRPFAPVSADATLETIIAVIAARR